MAIDEVADEVAAIQKAGGDVSLVYFLWRKQSWLEDLFDDPGGPDDPVGYWAVYAEGHGTFSDAGLQRFEGLKGLADLDVLDLAGSRITDSGLQHVRGLNSVKELRLQGTNITDAGLEHLKGLNKMERLDLDGTKVTDEGAKKLKRALPKCKIEHYRR